MVARCGDVLVLLFWCLCGGVLCVDVFGGVFDMVVFFFANQVCSGGDFVVAFLCWCFAVVFLELLR